ncbi:hypothetical protein [Corallococcus sp. Z5C101001]|uniref:hypothetical protein n=1 Tax=Corallococcus sp. Z5C101001 TaxID=2596829 RepID=UPI00117DB0A6|nr:hypothetical protein [Corallococcus sp. Z5C101001]TSC23553.1 hypothetical protein FOF48_28760 [Corallococcus sp. Z5C101001]
MLKKGIVSGMLLLGGFTMLAGCDSESKAPEVISSHEKGNASLLIERVGGTGPYVGRAEERFRVVASDEAFKSVRWSASSGTLTPDSDAVTWTLPGEVGQASLSVEVETESGKKAEGSFSFSVVAPQLTTNTVVDASPDKTGGTCELAFGDDGKGHLLYSNETHRSLWYATWDGTTWRKEQIDGPGFNTGGYITNAAMALDPRSGTPHVTYLRRFGSTTPSGEAQRIVYATRVNGVWSKEEISATSRLNVPVLSIALNPAQGQQPTIVFTETVSTPATFVATRTAPGTWSIVRPVSSSTVLLSNPLFDAAGTLYLFDSATVLSAIRGSTVDIFRPGYIAFQYSQSISATFDANNHVLGLLSGGADGATKGLMDIAPGTPMSTSVMLTSITDFENDAADLAFDGSKPIAALRRGTTLELSSPDAQGLWTYSQWGSVQDGSRLSVAIRPTDGAPHVCYQLDGKVNFQ